MTNTGKDTLKISFKASKEHTNGLYEIYTDSDVAEWIILDKTECILKSGESQNIDFTIKSPSHSDFCDTRMVICITATPLNNNVMGQFNVIQGLELYIPLTLNVPAQIYENIQISAQNPKLIFSFIPTNFSYQLTNNGTVKETINSILDIQGFKNYNLKNSINAMPGDQKNINLNWTPGIFDMGPYNLNLKSEYGDYGTHHTTEDKTTIFVFPWHILVITGLTGYIIYKKRKK